MAGNENGGVRNEEVSSVQGVGRAMRLKTFSALALFFGLWRVLFDGSFDLGQFHGKIVLKP